MKQNKVTSWIKKELTETQLLLKNIPAVVVTLFAIAVVAMNLMANKTIVSLFNAEGEQWFALDGGILAAWLPFMCMDIITKHYGPKAATKISILAILINVVTCILFWVVSIIPSEGFAEVDYVLGGTWFILLSSTIAFISSAVVNNFTNWTIGKAFKKNPDGKAAFFTRSYVSTFIGQVCDNLIFSVFTFMVFGPIFWDFGWSFTACLMCSLTGAVAELLMEVIFSPFAYKICAKWKRENIGQQYIDFISNN